MNIVNITGYSGLAFLTFICFLDFKKKIPKPKPVLPFYVALCLFLLANAVVYIGLLSFLAEIEVDLSNFRFYWSGGDNVKLFRYRRISPLIIAVLYFGFGKARVEIGNREFVLYDSMLNIFRSMFPLSLGVSRKIDEYIDKLGDETEKLKQTISQIQEIAKNYGWILFENEWEKIVKSQDLIEDDIEFLVKVKSSLSKENLNDTDISSTKEDIIRQIEKSRLNLNEELRKYIKKIITTNIVHEKAIEEIVALIDVKQPDEIITKKRSNYIARAFGISFLCGILLSTVYSITGSVYTPTERILYLVASFFFFLSIFSFINKMPNSFEGFSFSLLIGALGGFIGHLAFLIVSRKVQLAEDNLISFGYYASLIIQTIRGSVLGTVSAGIAFVFKHELNEKIKPLVLKYISISLAGGIAFLSVSFLFGDVSFGGDLNYQIILSPILTGCIVLMGVSFVAGIFEKKISIVERTKISEDKIKNSRNNIKEYKINSTKNSTTKITSYPPGG